MNTDRKAHWEQVYATRQHHELSWIQPVPETSLQLIRALQLPAQAAIIDVGGGDSLLVDHLLAEGFTDITVLDISAQSL
nr:SAM-dependent methyltransferase [Chitinophagaceae bacterium]